jgi:nitrilase
MVVAALQMVSEPNVNVNLLMAEKLIEQAAQAGARLVVLPENFAFMGEREADKLALRETEGKGPLQTFLSKQAVRHKIWLVGGTIPLAAEDLNKVRASCLVFDDTGQQVGRYDKIHLFDVHLPQADESYCESDTIEPGSSPVILETPFGRLGLAVCYDLRFPELMRNLLDQGLEIFALPAAFTATTGKAHWELLVRVRAVENLCYVIGAAQGGQHASGRKTFGDSMVVNPWGEVLARLPQGPGVVLAPLDRSGLANLREVFPVLQHRRFSSLTTASKKSSELPNKSVFK